MATVDNYKIKITVDGKEEVIDLNEKLQTFGSNVSKAATAGVAAFAALGASAVKMAADIDGLSKATGIATADLYKLGRALEISGGEFGDSAKLIQTFARTLGQIEKGSDEAVDAFSKLGIGRKELETLSDQELFNRVIQGLGNMEAGFERTALAQQLLGKGAATLEFDKLAANLDKAVDPDIARRMELAADAMDNITTAFRELQAIALQVVTPILEKIAQFEVTAEGARKTIQVLGALIAAAFAASVVLQMRKIIALFKTMAQVIRGAAAAKAFLVGLSGVGLAAIAAAATAATAAYIALGKAIGDAGEEQAQLDGTAGTTATTPSGTATRTVGTTPEERALAAVKEQTRQMRERNAEANRYQRIIIETIGKSQEEADLIKSMIDLERQAGNEKLNIQKQIDAELTKGKDSNQAIVVELQKQLVEVDRQLGIQKQLKREEQDRLNIEIARSLTLEKIGADLLNSNKQTLAYNEKAIKLNEINGYLTSEQAKRELELVKLQNDQAKQLNALELQLLNAKSIAEETSIRQRLQSLKEAHSIEIQQLKEKQELQDKLNNSAIAGSIAALENISRQFEPYKMAQDAILQTWSKIGSAVDDFVKTGKFKFSDFARSVIQDLAAMIIKAQIFKAIQGTLGMFGLSIPGLATGGPAKAGQPYIVGEKGPELFVPKQSGTVIPNNKLAATTQATATGTVNAPVTNNYITNNINAIDAKSVAQLFAENRKTLLGSVRMAERELPYSMGY